MGRSNFKHCFKNLYAIIRDNSHHNSRPPPKIWECHVDDVFSIAHKAYLQELLDQIINLHPQIQFTKEEENNYSSIHPHLSPRKLRQNHLGKNLQKTNTYKPVPEMHITQSNICKTKCHHCLIRPSRQRCFK